MGVSSTITVFAMITEQIKLNINQSVYAEKIERKGFKHHHIGLYTNIEDSNMTGSKVIKLKLGYISTLYGMNTLTFTVMEELNISRMYGVYAGDIHDGLGIISFVYKS
jgi:hypothetical protein